jgi:hypothetical protein
VLSPCCRVDRCVSASVVIDLAHASNARRTVIWCRNREREPTATNAYALLCPLALGSGSRKTCATLTVLESFGPCVARSVVKVMEPELWPRGRDSTASALVQASRSSGLEGARVVAKVESRHLLRSTGGVVVAAGTLYEQLAQLVPVSFGGGDVAVGDCTEVVKSACGPWISQKCPSDINVSAIEVDDQHQGQRARLAWHWLWGRSTCHSAPTSHQQPRLLHHSTTWKTVHVKSNKASFVFSKVLAKKKSCSCPANPKAMLSCI